MAAFRVNNFAELLTAVATAVNGDDILFTSTSAYASTDALVIDKSLNFALGPGVKSVTINLDHNYTIEGQSGGTIQDWTGPFIFDRNDPSSNVVSIGGIQSGPISLAMSNVTFQNGNTGVSVLDVGHSVTCTLIDCIARSNSNDGFAVGGTGLTTLFLQNCTTLDVTGEGLRVRDSGNLVATDCTLEGHSSRALSMTDSSTASLIDCTLKGHTDGVVSLIQHSSTGTLNMTRCTGTNYVSHLFFSGEVSNSVFRECAFTNNTTNRSVLSLPISGATVSCYDCTLTQVGDLANVDMISSAGDILMRRCVLDASSSAGSPSSTIYMVDPGANCTLQGNVFILPETVGGSSVYCARFPNGIISAQCSHNTFVKSGTSVGTANGLLLNEDKEVRGNIFAGLTNGLETGGTSDYQDNTTSGYNVFYNNTIDIVNATDNIGDQLSIPYDPFLDSANKDFRLTVSTLANLLDPSAAYQIDYHQISIVKRGLGSVSTSLSPDVDLTDTGPTDAGAYNNANIFPTVTLTATPNEGWIFGRWGGETLSTDNPFVFTLTSSQVITVYFFSDITPHLTSPKGGEVFNLGKVDIEWDTNNPLALNANSLLSYEIEYTDDYVGVDATNWHSTKRRIPWNQISYEWIVGKMIKSDSIRVRMRARHHDGSFSDWSMASGNFAINVFKIIPPAIVNPVPYHVYTDFILIILDETLTINTFSQKVRYTLEYSSDARNIGWTTIVKDVPVGQNVVRWDLEDVASSDDYVLRLTAKNASTSCKQTSLPTPDQISRRFIYNLKIQQPGLFIIDTKPPQAILDVESSSDITSELTQTLTIFAEDATSDVEQIQLRECNASQQLALGDVSDTSQLGTTDCTSIKTLLEESDLNFDTIIGKPQGYTAKTQWVFEDVSGLRRLEAMLTDSGGNNSLQSLQNTFIPVFRAGTDTINDILVVSEVRDVHENVTDDTTGITTIITTPNVDFEVAYIGTQSGNYWALEPFPRLVFELGKEIRLLIEYFDVVYLLVYVSASDIGSIYRDDKIRLTNVFDFDQDALKIPNAVAIFRDVLYIGLENGELWSFNGLTPTRITQFANPVTTLVGDNLFLYIGQANSSEFVLYNGTEFFTSDLEP